MINPKDVGERSVLDLIDDLGTYQAQEARPIERPKQVETAIRHVGRADVWPPETLAEIRRILGESAHA